MRRCRIWLTRPSARIRRSTSSSSKSWRRELVQGAEHFADGSVQADKLDAFHAILLEKSCLLSVLNGHHGPARATTEGLGDRANQSWHRPRIADRSQRETKPLQKLAPVESGPALRRFAARRLVRPPPAGASDAPAFGFFVRVPFPVDLFVLVEFLQDAGRPRGGRRRKSGDEGERRLESLCGRQLSA